MHTSRLWKHVSLSQTEPSAAWPQGKWSVWALTFGLGAKIKLIFLTECDSFLNGCLNEWMRGHILTLIHKVSLPPLWWLYTKSVLSFIQSIVVKHLGQDGHRRTCRGWRPWARRTSPFSKSNTEEYVTRQFGRRSTIVYMTEKYTLCLDYLVPLTVVTWGHQSHDHVWWLSLGALPH